MSATSRRSQGPPVDAEVIAGAVAIGVAIGAGLAVTARRAPRRRRGWASRTDPGQPDRPRDRTDQAHGHLAAVRDRDHRRDLRAARCRRRLRVVPDLPFGRSCGSGGAVDGSREDDRNIEREGGSGEGQVVRGGFAGVADRPVCRRQPAAVCRLRVGLLRHLGATEREDHQSRAIPTIMAAPGAVLVTSNKRDVVDATRDPRAKRGRVWVFDPQAIAGERVELVVEPLELCPQRAARARARRRVRARRPRPGRQNGRVLRHGRAEPRRADAAGRGVREAVTDPGVPVADPPDRFRAGPGTAGGGLPDRRGRSAGADQRAG